MTIAIIFFSTIRKKIAKKGGNLFFFSYFYIWDEALLLPSPLHVPSTSTFGMKHFLAFSPCSFNIELSTLFKPCVSRLLKVMRYSSLGALLSSGKWNEEEMR
jgi:hypothetical protein